MLQLNFENSIRVKLDSLTNFYFSPMFTSVQGTSINKQSSSTFRDNTLLNTNDSYTKSDTENNNFGSMHPSIPHNDSLSQHLYNGT